MSSEPSSEETETQRLYGQALRARHLPNLRQRITKAILVEVGVIVGVGGSAAIASLVHWRWWSTEPTISRGDVLGDTVAPMVGGAVLTLIVQLWRWPRLAANARAALWATDQRTIAELRAENERLLTIAENPEAPAKAMARTAYMTLIRAKARLPGFSTVSDLEAPARWADLKGTLEKYQVAYKELRPAAHKTHDRIYRELYAASREDKRDLAAIAEAADELMDVLALGECDLDVFTSNVIAYPFKSGAGQRQAFAVVSVCITNCEEQPVALLPTWHLSVRYSHTLFGMMQYDVDAEPL